MSNPQNGTQATTSSTPNTLLNHIDSLLGGTKWGGNVGSGATLTYSFPGSNSSSATWASNPNYSDSNEPSSAFALSAMEQVATRNALATWANVASLNFSEITDTSSNVGDLRITWTNKTDTVTGGGQAAAWAGYPHDFFASGGDVWLSAPAMKGDPASSWHPGGGSYKTLIHEIGHALGLKHPFGAGIILPTSQDSEQYSLMSYTSYSDNLFRKVTQNGNSFSWTTSSIEPSTPMLYDIAAIQYMYGKNMSYKTGDDVYKFDPNTPFYQTIWDAAGNDTILISDFSLGSTIDLRAGNYSTISFLSDPLPQGATTTSIATYTGNNDLAIAYDTVIENAIGGSGNDTLIGNSVNNTLNGGLGTDTAIFDGNKSSYKVSKSGSNYTVTSVAEGIDTLTNVEFLKFNDGTFPIDSVLQAANNSPTGLVIISGDIQQGKTLTASNTLADADGLGTISYQWLSGGNVISGATQANYTLTTADIGKTINVKASYTDLKGTAESMTSSATALVIISGNGGTMFNANNDIYLLQASDNLNISKGIGDDKYILSNGGGIRADQSISVIDTEGTNTFQLIDGLTITSSKATSNAIELTLTNGGIVRILGAATYHFEVGGDPLHGIAGTIQDFSTFLTSSLGFSTLPTSTSSLVTGASNLLVNSNGTTTENITPVISVINIAASNNDIHLLQASDNLNISKWIGDDKYILSNGGGIRADQSISVIDTEGTNTFQLIDGLTIASSKATSNAIELTLSNGGIVRILGTATYHFEVGGDPLHGIAGTIQDFSTFLTSSLGFSTLPTSTSSLVMGASNVLVNSNGTTSVGSGLNSIVLPVGQTTTALTTVSATNAADVFTLNVGAAKASAPNTQDTITGFNVTADKLALSGTGITPGTYTLANTLAGIGISTDPFAAQPAQIVNFGSDANGDLITLSLVGVTTANLVNVTIVS